ncbi:hypothetical protein KEM48_003193 [Puccinia striiformis f. sp. tritici PST-130]|nr:hypothetical protein KEM48_003193 [Puccinia striiformis f. sp. tritici PST-130]
MFRSCDAWKTSLKPSEKSEGFQDGFVTSSGSQAVSGTPASETSSAIPPAWTTSASRWRTALVRALPPLHQMTALFHHINKDQIIPLLSNHSQKAKTGSNTDDIFKFKLGPSQYWVFPPQILRPHNDSVAEHPLTELYGDQYCLLSTDLREPLGLVEKLSAPPPGEGGVQGPLLSRTAGPLMIVSSQALNLNDNSSKMMVQNLAVRLNLAGFSENQSLESQIERMRKHGYQEIVSTDMKTPRLGSTISGSSREDDEWKKEWETELNRIKNSSSWMKSRNLN